MDQPILSGSASLVLLLIVRRIIGIFFSVSHHPEFTLRRRKTHAQNHFTKTKHPLALDINDKKLYCHECDEDVMLPPLLTELVSKLTEEQTQMEILTQRKLHLRRSAIFGTPMKQCEFALASYPYHVTMQIQRSRSRAN